MAGSAYDSEIVSDWGVGEAGYGNKGGWSRYDARNRSKYGG